MMGTGKSTLGKILAQELKKKFYDLDEMIEREAGIVIPEIFKQEGERGFRKRETEIIQSLSDYGDFVLATGGGAVLSEVNQCTLKELGWIVWLMADPHELMTRMEVQDGKRPLLAVENPLEVIENIYQKRKSIYNNSADFMIDTTGKTVTEMVRSIIKAFLMRETRKPSQTRTEKCHFYKER